MRVENQTPPLREYNLVAGNRPLLDGLRREGAAWYEDELLAFGAELGREPLEWGRLANEHPPRLRARERDRGAAVRRRRGDAARAQVVLLGADVRRVPRARTGTRRAHVLLAPARASRRDAQRVPPRAAEGQARQSLQRVGRGQPGR